MTTARGFEGSRQVEVKAIDTILALAGYSLTDPGAHWRFPQTERAASQLHVYA